MDGNGSGSGLNPVHMGWQRMARMSAGSILYQSRVGRVQKPALDVLGHIMCEIIESLFRSAKSFSNGTPSLILYEGFPDEQLISLRPGPDFVHEASTLLDMASTCLAVNPSPFLFLSGLGTSTSGWNPGYVLADLLEYARIQGRFGEAQGLQGDHVKRMVEASGAGPFLAWNRPTDRLPKSIFENSGFINVAYTVIPRPACYVEALPELPCDSSTLTIGDITGIESKRPLENIQEEQV